MVSGAPCRSIGRGDQIAPPQDVKRRGAQRIAPLCPEPPRRSPPRVATGAPCEAGPPAMPLSGGGAAPARNGCWQARRHRAQSIRPSPQLPCAHGKRGRRRPPARTSSALRPVQRSEQPPPSRIMSNRGANPPYGRDAWGPTTWPTGPSAPAERRIRARRFPPAPAPPCAVSPRRTGSPAARPSARERSLRAAPAAERRMRPTAPRPPTMAGALHARDHVCPAAAADPHIWPPRPQGPQATPLPRRAGA